MIPVLANVPRKVFPDNNPVLASLQKSQVSAVTCNPVRHYVVCVHKPFTRTPNAANGAPRRARILDCRSVRNTDATTVTKTSKNRREGIDKIWCSGNYPLEQKQGISASQRGYEYATVGYALFGIPLQCVYITVMSAYITETACDNQYAGMAMTECGRSDQPSDTFSCRWRPSSAAL